jgi:hypothetical protein
MSIRDANGNLSTIFRFLQTRNWDYVRPLFFHVNYGSEYRYGRREDEISASELLQLVVRWFEEDHANQPHSCLVSTAIYHLIPQCCNTDDVVAAFMASSHYLHGPLSILINGLIWCGSDRDETIVRKLLNNQEFMRRYKHAINFDAEALCNMGHIEDIREGLELLDAETLDDVLVDVNDNNNNNACR